MRFAAPLAAFAATLLVLPGVPAETELPTVTLPDWDEFLDQLDRAVDELYPTMQQVGELADEVVALLFGVGSLADPETVEEFVALLPAGDCLYAADKVACVRDFVFAIIRVNFAVNGLYPPVGITSFDPQIASFGFMVAGFGVSGLPSMPGTSLGGGSLNFGAGHWYVSINS